MPDITMCSGANCPLKDKCYRATAKPSEHLQSWFSKAPVKSECGLVSCDHYVGQGNNWVEVDNA